MEKNHCSSLVLSELRHDKRHQRILVMISWEGIEMAYSNQRQFKGKD